jgi:hypothetical protein
MVSLPTPKDREVPRSGESLNFGDLVSDLGQLASRGITRGIEVEWLHRLEGTGKC